MGLDIKPRDDRRRLAQVAAARVRSISRPGAAQRQPGIVNVPILVYHFTAPVPATYKFV
jgi:hypothetical protein